MLIWVKLYHEHTNIIDMHFLSSFNTLMKAKTETNTLIKLFLLSERMIFFLV